MVDKHFSRAVDTADVVADEPERTSPQSAPEISSKRTRRSKFRKYRFGKNKGMPMSNILVLIIIAISAIGLSASAIAVQTTIKGVIYNSVDEDLNRSMDSWAVSLEIFHDLQQQAVAKVKHPPNDFYLAWIYPDGSSAEIKGHNGESKPDWSQIHVGSAPVNVPSSADSADSVQWRVIARERNGITVVVAKDVTQETMILQRLALGQFIIGAIVLALIAIAAFYIIKRTFRPLKEVEATATAIAAGNLDRRVPEYPINTEVGSLSASLNIMIEQLQRLIIELRDKEEQMRRFVGDASHELRTPLTSVKGYAELYRTGATTDAQLVVDKIEKEASRMSVLVEDLLALTRAEGMQFEEKPVDLLELNLALANSLRATYPQRSIDVSTTMNEVPLVLGDASRLHQVFSNLIVNALKHGGEQAEVRVVLREGNLGDNPAIVADVVDNGVGMNAQDAAHIFERFYRADVSRTRSTGGSGLGLAITKSLVESQHGEISVLSQPGVGTTFRVVLPRVI
ncbi:MULTISPECIES: cell wall metabolism sensor histidine kinase WalK [unclassified Corynebacterium]|uniref:sensor histidine kinase n=1 Tax=unclassified Corynebacterium TaxID=2624378 RepID=UPI001FEDCF9A|nr:MULTISPECIES: HAMP domain-containing sensor histidine kinase [unclassified Corynebacterium]